MNTLYRYVGPAEIHQAAIGAPGGACVTTPDELVVWLASSQGEKGKRHSRENNVLVATFVVDVEGRLRLADRHTEHVACSSGKGVRSAGEMTFTKYPQGWQVTAISNQSTGYCPEPSSWPAVAAALAPLEMAFPPYFTQVFEFRRCPQCRQLVIVKDEEYLCLVCGAALPSTWNIA